MKEEVRRHASERHEAAAGAGGAFMALQIRRIDTTGFAGQWSSGLEGRVASGYVCARRMTER